MVLAADLYEPNVSLLTAAAVTLGLWYFALAAIAIVRWPQIPEPDPPTNKLRAHSPALANMLTNGWLATEDSLPATLLDLAARGYVAIEDRGDGEPICRLPSRHPPVGELRSYEMQVFDHLRSLARDGVVPAGALTTGPQDQSAKWWKKFRSEVADEAKAAGLARDFWTVKLSALFVALGIPVYVLLQAAQGFKDSDDVHMTPFVYAVTYALWAGVVVLVLIAKTSRMRDTMPGRAAAAHWLGVRDSLKTAPSFRDLPPGAVTTWERHLAYGAALGVAGRAVKTLPLGAEHDRRAWTNYGGGWKQVRVAYPRFRPGWGNHPGFALAIGVARTVLALWLVTLAARLGAFDSSTLSGNAWWVRLIVWFVAILLVAFAAWSFVGVIWAVMDLGGSTIVEGEVLRTRPKTAFGPTFGSSNDDNEVYFVAIYPGSGDRIVAWRVREKLYPSFVQGHVVKVEVTPRLGYVKDRID
ncbi:MAG: hypothetical protein QOG54_2171 [Actinomycetota bacterium]|nr:hypothetical protein [Actinomycetota bacterium]